MMLKKEATNIVNRLKLAGYHVIVNQNNRKMRSGQKGMADYIAIGKKLCWLELKLENDKPSMLQDSLMMLMKRISKRTKFVVAEYLTPSNIEKTIDKIMSE